MDLLQWFVVIMAVLTLVLLGVAAYRRWALQRFVDDEDQRINRFNQETEQNWEREIARHRATTLGHSPPEPPSTGPDAKS